MKDFVWTGLEFKHINATKLDGELKDYFAQKKHTHIIADIVGLESRLELFGATIDSYETTLDEHIDSFAHITLSEKNLISSISTKSEKGHFHDVSSIQDIDTAINNNFTLSTLKTSFNSHLNNNLHLTPQILADINNITDMSTNFIKKDGDAFSGVVTQTIPTLTDGQMRNIHLSNEPPTSADGIDGDLFFLYEV